MRDEDEYPDIILPLIYKTLITREMLKSGYLASNLFFASTAHNENMIKAYIKELEKPINLIRECEDGKNIEELNLGEICHDGFKRLN